MANAKNYKKIAMTIFASGMAFVVNYFISFFLAPFITERVGTEAYGFVTMAKDFAVYATYITVALNSYAARFISLEYYKPDIKQANIYFSSTFWGDLILGGGIFALAMAATAFLEKLLQIPPELVADVKLLFLFVFIKFLLVTVCSVFNTSAYITNHLDLTGVIKGVSYCVEAGVLVAIFSLFPAKASYVGLGILAAALVVVLGDVWICRKYTRELRIRRRDFRFSAVKTLVANGVWSSVSQFGNLLNSGLDLTVCNLMLSPLAMGQLAITQSIGTIYTSLYHIVSESFKPMLLQIYSKNDKPRLIREFNAAIKISGFVSNLVFAGFFALGMVYYQLWMPHEDTKLLFELTMIVLGSNLLTGIESPLFYIYTLTLTRKVSCMFTLIIGVLNVISMYVLIHFFHMGIYAVVGTTLVLQSLIHLGPHPLYMSHVLKIKWYSFYPAILRSLLSCGVLCAVFVGLRELYLPHSWLTLILCALVYAAVGAAIHLAIVMNRQERAELFARLKRRFRKTP